MNGLEQYIKSLLLLGIRKEKEMFGGSLVTDVIVEEDYSITVKLETGQDYQLIPYSIKKGEK